MSRIEKTIKRVTIKDVALKAGVSKSTVSLALKNSPLISRATTDNVISASIELGYVYNRSAANLRTQRSNIIGVIISDLSNPFFSEVVTAIQNDLERRGEVLMLSNTAESPERQRQTISTLLEHNVDGLFISPAKYSTREHLGPLLTNPVPSVFINRYLTDFPGNYVGADNVTGSAMATERLLSAGHRRIAFIGGGMGSSPRAERLGGFTQAHERYGIAVDPDMIIMTDGTRHGGYDAVRRLVEEPAPPTAAFCYNDFIALGVLLGLQSKGVRPGRDFAVFGFDDISEARYWSPSLSTVSIPPEVIGKRAARMLLDQVGKRDEPERILIAPKLAIRDSCGTKGRE